MELIELKNAMFEIKNSLVKPIVMTTANSRRKDE